MTKEDIQALCRPDVPMAETIRNARMWMKAEPLMDVIVAGEFLAPDAIRALDESTVLRTLDILDQVSVGTRMVPLLRHLISHHNSRIRSKAVLLTSRRVGCLRWFRVQLALAGSDARIRASIIEALWHNPDPCYNAILQEHLRDPDNRVVGNVIYALHLRGLNVTPFVLQMARHKDAKFRATAAWLMGKIGLADFVAVLKGMVADNGPHVKGTALRSLSQIHRGKQTPPETASLYS